MSDEIAKFLTIIIIFTKIKRKLNTTVCLVYTMDDYGWIRFHITKYKYSYKWESSVPRQRRTLDKFLVSWQILLLARQQLHKAKSIYQKRSSWIIISCDFALILNCLVTKSVDHFNLLWLISRFVISQWKNN